MTKPSCGTCRFFDPDLGHVGTDEETGSCRRYAPRPIVGSMNGAQSDTIWPINYADEWCGEFEPGTTAQKPAADESLWPTFRALLSVRVGNCLDSEGIDSFAKLDPHNEVSLRRIRHFGSHSFKTLRDARRGFPGMNPIWELNLYRKPTL